MTTFTHRDNVSYFNDYVPVSPWDRWLDEVESYYGARVMGVQGGEKMIDELYGLYMKGGSAQDAAAMLLDRPKPLPFERELVALAQAMAVGLFLGVMIWGVLRVAG
jgi:hypothetical protein